MIDDFVAAPEEEQLHDNQLKNYCQIEFDAVGGGNGVLENGVVDLGVVVGCELRVRMFIVGGVWCGGCLL